MNEVFCVHYMGEFLARKAGSRVGSVYNTQAKAKAQMTRIANQWTKAGQWRSGDPEKLSVVRYVPEVV